MSANRITKSLPILIDSRGGWAGMLGENGEEYPSRQPPGMGIRLAAIGDSITAFGGFGASASGAVTLSGRVATIPLTNHGEVVGNTITLHLPQFFAESWQGLYQVDSVVSKDAFTVVLPTIPPGLPGTIAVIGSRSMGAQNYLEEMNFRLGSPFEIVVNAGIGGNTTDQMRARFAQDVLSNSPDIVSIMGGLNNIRYIQTAVAKDNAVADLIFMCKQVLAIGKPVLLWSIPPVRSDDQGFAIVTPLIISANIALSVYAAQTPGVFFADSFAELVDNSSVDNRGVSGYYVDSVHWNKIAAWKASRAGASALQDYAPNPMSLINSNSNTYAYSTRLKNRLSNPLFIRSGGTLNAGVTSEGGGTTGIAEGWSGSAGGTASAVVSLVPRTIADDGDTSGNNQRMVITSLALDDSGTLRTTQAITEFSAGDSLGYDFVLTVRNSVNVKFMVIDLSVVIAGQTYHQYIDAGSSSLFPNGDITYRGIKRSLNFKLPAAPTSMNLSIQTQFLGAGTATVDIGRAEILAR